MRQDTIRRDRGTPFCAQDGGKLPCGYRDIAPVLRIIRLPSHNDADDMTAAGYPACTTADPVNDRCRPEFARTLRINGSVPVEEQWRYAVIFGNSEKRARFQRKSDI